MVQSLEQSEGKRKCRRKGKDFPLILIPQGRKEGTNSKTWRSGSQGRAGQAPRVLNCDYSPVTTPHPMASGQHSTQTLCGLPCPKPPAPSTDCIASSHLTFMPPEMLSANLECSPLPPPDLYLLNACSPLCYTDSRTPTPNF